MAHLQFSSKKVNLNIFMDEFNSYARNGFIGDPNGEDAWGYLRVSTDGQTKENKNGVPRQIENLHNAALRDGVRISWDWLYGDDESGYMLERPALQLLLKNTAAKPTNEHIVFESISRMSRQWQWQQGWLLEQFEDLRKMEVHFFDQAGTPLERMFKGYVAGEAMEQQKKLMVDGKKRKAQRGFVNFGKPAFGFKAAAKEGYDPTRIREFTTWVALWDGDPMSPNGCTRYGEANIVVEIYEMLAYRGLSGYKTAEELQRKYGPPRKYMTWFQSYIDYIVKNPANYGKFASNRISIKKVETLNPDGSVSRKWHRKTNPESEWIYVDIEPIVSKELWELANRALTQNKKMSGRNMKIRDYLLTGLLKCAHCGYAWIASTKRHKSNKKNPTAEIFTQFYYICSSKTTGRKPYMQAPADQCPSNHFVKALDLEAIVWDAVRNVIFHPEALLIHIDSLQEGVANQQIHSQITYIENQIKRRELTDRGDRELFDNGFMKISEYGPKHKAMAGEIAVWETDIENLRKKLMTKEDAEAAKARILAIAKNARRYEIIDGEVPLEFKKNLIKMCVDAVYIDVVADKIRIVGEIGDVTRSLEIDCLNMGNNADKYPYMGDDQEGKEKYVNGSLGSI